MYNEENIKRLPGEALERLEKLYESTKIDLFKGENSLLYMPEVGKKMVIRQLGENGEIENEKEVVIKAISFQSRADWGRDVRELYNEETMTKVSRTDYYYNEDFEDYHFDGDIRITKYEKEVVINKEDVQSVQHLNQRFNETLDRYMELSEQLFKELELMRELDEKIKESELNVRYEDEVPVKDATCSLTWEEVEKAYGRSDEDETNQ